MVAKAQHALQKSCILPKICDIIVILEYKSDDFTADELNDLRKRIVSGLEKEIANAVKTSKIANMKAYYNAQVERMRADRKTAYLYSR